MFCNDIQFGGNYIGKDLNDLSGPIDFTKKDLVVERLKYEISSYKKRLGELAPDLSSLDIDSYVDTRAFEVSMLEFYNTQSTNGRTICSDKDDTKNVDVLNEIINDKNLEMYVRFGAFVFLFTAYRREDHPNAVFNLVRENIGTFKKIEVYPQYELLSYTNQGKFQLPDVKDKINRCEKLCEKLGDNIGVINAASEIVATYAEYDLLKPANLDPELLVKKYIDLMKNAIDHNQYGQYSSFYATLGQLYAQDKQYELARESIRRAIDEDKTNQRSVRVIKWRNILIYIDTKEEREKILEKTVEYEKKIDNIKKDYDELIKKQEHQNKIQNEKNILMLTILSGFVGLIVGSMDITSGISLSDGAAFILAFMGCIMISVGLLIFALADEKSEAECKKGKLIMILGSVVLVLFIVLFAIDKYIH